MFQAHEGVLGISPAHVVDFVSLMNSLLLAVRVVEIICLNFNVHKKPMALC